MWPPLPARGYLAGRVVAEVMVASCVSGIAGALDSGRVAPYPDPTSPGAHRHRLNRAIVRPIDTNTPLDTAAAPVTGSS